MTPPASDSQRPRVVLVTGAGRGIGREIALAFAHEGATVVLAGRSRDALDAVQNEIGRERARVLPMDVRIDADVARAMGEVHAEFGHVDVLCANSGIAGPTAPLWEIEPEQWDETFAVNVRGVYLCARAVLPAMIAHRAGTVVVVGSVSGREPLPGRTPYCASKTALIGLVRTLAAEAGPHGVRVNLVSPGPVAGERLDRVIAGQAELRGRSADEVRTQMLTGVPLGRFTEAGDIADTVLYLASSRAAAVTGQDVTVASGAVMA